MLQRETHCGVQGLLSPWRGAGQSPAALFLDRGGAKEGKSGPQTHPRPPRKRGCTRPAPPRESAFRQRNAAETAESQKPPSPVAPAHISINIFSADKGRGPGLVRPLRGENAGAVPEGCFFLQAPLPRTRVPLPAMRFLAKGHGTLSHTLQGALPP